MVVFEVEPEAGVGEVAGLLLVQQLDLHLLPVERLGDGRQLALHVARKPLPLAPASAREGRVIQCANVFIKPDGHC